MGTSARIEHEVMPHRNCEAKDEMNLAEFPLCALAHRLNPEVRTLRFEDRIVDKSTGKTITRQLTITGSDAYGLPTEKDDEVLLGLIQLTRLRGFEERKVHFTRHELIRILSWRDDSKSYARIEASLNRWTGVTLYWDKAWWNKQRKCWMDEKFHILDNVWLCHRGEPAPDTGLTTTGAPQSAFVWNETIFRSFTHGNLKSIDFEFFKSLKSAVAKRLYRFLDKRFYHRNRWEFDLRELGCGHVGLSRTYDTANLKRKLLPGIRELEVRGFLRAALPTERFKKIRRGQWSVEFERTQAASLSRRGNSTELTALTQALVERGVTAIMASQTVELFPEKQVRRHMAVFDWLVLRNDPKVSRNPAGFLVHSIQKDYSMPKQFESREQRPQARVVMAGRRDARRNATQPEAESSKREVAIAGFWASLPCEARLEAEAQAVSEARGVERTLIERGGAFAESARKNVFDAYALKRLQRSQ